MKDFAILALSALWGSAGLGCQVPRPPEAAQEPERTVVGWRLVERTYGEADPARAAAGDGEIPAPSKLLIHEPVFAEARTREFGALTLRTVCEHEIRLRIVGGLTRTVGERVTAECRIDGPGTIYHEVAVEPTSAQIDILGVRGAARAAGKSGRYLVPGDRPFEVMFTSRVAGRGTVTISVLREVGQDPAARATQSAALAARER
jgi:hypothetical protein